MGEHIEIQQPPRAAGNANAAAAGLTRGSSRGPEEWVLWRWCRDGGGAGEA